MLNVECRMSNVEVNAGGGNSSALSTRHSVLGLMLGHFHDRIEAGQMLGAAVAKKYGGRGDVLDHWLVRGLPRGGVPGASGVAQALGAPLDVFVVRKLGVPGHEELAMGAIATGGVRVLNRDVLD